MKEEQNRARDVGRSSRGTHNGKSPITDSRRACNLPFSFQAVDLLEVIRSPLNLVTVLFTHVIYSQVVADEVPFVWEEDEAEEADFYLSL